MFQAGPGSWRIVWNVSNELFAGSGLLQAYLNNSRGELIALPINQLGTGKGETWMHNHNGKFYWEIMSTNCNWEIQIFK